MILAWSNVYYGGYYIRVCVCVCIYICLSYAIYPSIIYLSFTDTNLWIVIFSVVYNTFLYLIIWLLKLSQLLPKGALRAPGSPVPGILQARTLERVAISFSNAWKWKVKGKSLSCVRPSATPWTAAHQAPPSMGFSRQEYWSGVPLPSPISVPTLSLKRIFFFLPPFL